MSRAERAAVIEQFIAELNSHDSHEQKQVGPCVYCVTCNKRLYQGKLKENRNGSQSKI